MFEHAAGQLLRGEIAVRIAHSAQVAAIAMDQLSDRLNLDGNH